MSRPSDPDRRPVDPSADTHPRLRAVKPGSRSADSDGNRALLTLATLAVVALIAWLFVPNLFPEPEAPDLGPTELVLEPGPTAEPTVAPLPATPRPTPKPTVAAVEPAAGHIMERTGTLRVVAFPGARVLQSGAEIGHASPGGSPVSLEPGIQRLRFICADSPECADYLRRSHVEQFEVFAGEELSYRIDFRELNERTMPTASSPP